MISDGEDILVAIADLDFLRDATKNDPLTYLCAIEGIEVDDLVADLTIQEKTWTHLRTLLLLDLGIPEQEIPHWKNPMKLLKGEVKLVKSGSKPMTNCSNQRGMSGTRTTQQSNKIGVRRPWTTSCICTRHWKDLGPI